MYTHRHLGVRLLPAGVTAPPATVPRSAGRRGAALWSDRRLDAGAILIALLVLGLLLRVVVGGVLVPLSGFGIDIGDFAAWAQRLNDIGPGGFYETGIFADYPPGYLYVLWLLGWIGGTLEPLLGVDVTPGLVKIPGILADLGVAALLYAMTARFAGALLSRGSESSGTAGVVAGRQWLGLAAAGIYLFNPGPIFNSAIWGQVDSVGALVVLGAVYQLARGRTEVAAALAALALAVKFQYAFIIPVVAIVGLKRHLLGRSSDPDHRGRDPWRALSSLAAGLFALSVVIAPFGMAIWLPGATDPNATLVGKFFEAAGTYTGLTINAINLWMNPWSGLGDAELHWGDDTLPVVLAPLGAELARFGFTWQHVGLVLFAAFALLALWQVARRDDLRGVLLATTLLAVAFFVLPTRVHERYLFPALALAAPLALRAPSWAVCYAVLSASFFFNVYYVYTGDWSFVQDRVLNPGVGGVPMLRDPFLDATLLSPWGMYALAAAIVAALLWISWRSWRLTRARVEGTAMLPAVSPVSRMPTAPAFATRPTREPPPVVLDAGSAQQEALRAGAGNRPAWLERLRPARSLRRGPSRRLDRIDALLLVALVLAALLFRLWRLDAPRAMHFDEVYHARSAAEWLANWEHGWRRDVYEWTHPMLAKYLIAGGIALANPNRVLDTALLDRPATALAVAPKRSSIGHQRSVAFLAGGGSEIVAQDAESGEELARWEAGGDVGALAYDEPATRLLVGQASSGNVETYPLNAFLAATGPRGPPEPGDPIDTGLGGVQRIAISHGGGTAVAFGGEGGVSVHERATGGQLASAALDTADITLLPGTGAGILAASDPASRNVLLLNAGTLEASDSDAPGRGAISVEAELLGPLVARGEGDDRQLFALTGPLPETPSHPASPGGVAVIDADTEQLVDLVPLPGTGALAAWQPVANIVYVAGNEDGEPVVWAVEPHIDDRPEGSAGAAAFDETRLPGEALAIAFDVSGNAPADDAGHMLVTTRSEGGGSLVTVDAGSNAFAWRLAGVIFGSLLVGLAYLLGATMFRERLVAVLAGAFLAFDLMGYAMSRIAMNDIFVAVFIAAAYLLFWQVWSGRWRASAWWALPLVGACIGLAAASKWVGFYALAGLLVLVIGRSDMGRLLLLAGLTFAAVVAGVGAPWPFAVLLTLAAVLMLVLAVMRPPRVAADDLIGVLTTVVVASAIGLGFVLVFDSVGGRQAAGAVELVFGVLARGAQAGWPVAVMLVASAALIMARAVRSLREPSSDAAWFRPSSLGGFGWAWVGACLVVVPLLVYGLTYVPYLALGHDFAGASRGGGYGWTLEEMHAQMFSYHFGLTAGHDAASPWWSWPLDLKPVWFYSDSFDGQQTALIYNGGNPILFWAGIPAMGAAAWLAWRRGSLALAMLAVAFACQYLPWTRIERATFQYHYLTAVIFAMVAVAVFVAAGLRRPSWRDLAVGFLVATVLFGVVIFPIASALPMPDWYANAMRVLPPWNFYFQFPDPPSGQRGDLLAVDLTKALVGAIAAAAVVVFALALGPRGAPPQPARREQFSAES